MLNTQSIYLNEEHIKFRKKAADFIQLEIKPYLAEWEKQKFLPENIWRSLGKQGFLSLFTDLYHKKTNQDIFYALTFLEELGKTGYVGFRISVVLHAFIAVPYLTCVKNKFLEENYLKPAIAGEKIATLGISEISAGSDLEYITTTAVEYEQHYLINGNKKYVANGTIADFIILVVKTKQKKRVKFGAMGLTLLVVDLNLPGITKHRLDSLGIRGADIAEINFDNVSVPKKNLLGKQEQGFVYLMKYLQLERLATAASVLGEIEYCIRITWRYLKKRKIYDSTLNKLQTIRHRMATHLTNYYAAKELVYHTAYLFQHFDVPMVECSMAKFKVTELSKQIAQDCLQFQGAYGYTDNNDISRMYRDTAVETIGAGASGVMLDIIAQLGLDDKV